VGWAREVVDPTTGEAVWQNLDETFTAKHKKGKRNGDKPSFHNTADGIVMTKPDGTAKLVYEVTGKNKGKERKFNADAVKAVNTAMQNEKMLPIIQTLFKEAGYEFNITEEDVPWGADKKIPSLVPIGGEQGTTTTTPQENGLTWNGLFQQFTTPESRRFLQGMKQQDYPIEEAQEEAIKRFMGQ
jgi:hypothetical protein